VSEISYSHYNYRSTTKASGEYTTTSRKNIEKSILDDLDSSPDSLKKGTKYNKVRGQGQRVVVGGVSSKKGRVIDENVEDDDFYPDTHWSPTPYSAFKLFISARFAAALWTTISDCDETYNYWEPVSLRDFRLGP
jgi:hypothetical protein